MPIEELLRIGSVRPIVRWGSPVLHTPTRPVDNFGMSLQQLIADLFATNKAAGGAGLAAPQIGVDLAVFVYDCPDGSWRRRVGLVCNPVVDLPVGRERRLVEDDEGCLSLPGAYIQLARPDQATCRGQDQFGHDQRITGTGVLARCLQHETDHLGGRVFGDRLSARARRELFARQRRVAHLYPDSWPIESGQA